MMCTTQYDQSNAQSARRNLPIDLQGGRHFQRLISHDGYEHTRHSGECLELQLIQ